MRVLVTIGATGLLTGQALAADVTIKLDVPRLEVAEYHRPYIAIWVEGQGNTFAGNLAVWYHVDDAKKEGDKWLKDLRQWWRRSGNALTVPADGVTSATRPAGSHTVDISATKSVIENLKPGNYELVVEAAREVGGREVVRIPFQWPPAEATRLEAKGTDELGAVSLELKP